MKTQWTIGKKLMASFTGVALITLILGFVGYYGMTQMEDAIDEIGIVRLPSVQSVLQIEVELEELVVALRTLMNPRLSAEARRAQYAHIQAAREGYRAARAIYEPLPQREDEAMEWQAFVQVLPQWVEVNDEILAMHAEYDRIGIFDPAELAERLQGFRGDLYQLEMQVANLLLGVEDFEGGDDVEATEFGRWRREPRTEAAPIESALVLETLRNIRGAQDRAHGAVRDIRAAMAAGSRYQAERLFSEVMQPAVDEVLEGLYGMIEEAERADDLLDAAADLTMGRGYDILRQAMGHLERVVEINLEISDEEMAAAHRQAAFLEATALIASIVGVLLALGLGILITRSISKALQRIIEGLREGADQVASASGQVSSASQSLAEGSSEQAASIEETSSSLEEMSSMTKQNADNADQANGLMEESKKIVGSANASMTEMVSSMHEIREASEETSKIIKTIDEIAFQTNLLALNAAVEAARAGEAGAGFAVVADEVRNLAMRAAEAAKNTAALIEGTTKKVQDGSSLVERTNEEFSKVEQSAMKVAELVGEIAAASREQAEGIDQVNVAVADMDKVTQQNAANAEESASASEEMNAQAEQMKMIVDELVTLVGGAAKKHEGAQAGSSVTGRAVKGLPRPGYTYHPEAGSAARKSAPAAKTSGREVDPQKAIPFDEDESFKDF